ncbi:hypothetical protein FPOA_12264 [Fusarium poae]|uniref:HTH CENPB-type domain-containing protein n=1 Tax=Fusarium poae TaxID=36050 RepID=A0A1B8A9T3_FUSPO|nr:hypothetical protein FPOA_12264 [Fusarium poae]
MLRSRLRWKYPEDDVAEAILDVTDNGFSPPQAAHRRGVPRRTLIDRLHGRGAVKEQIHPHRRLSKRQEDRLAFWILRQESLGYAPSHSQIRACVMGLLRQQGEHPNLGRNWVIKFINCRADLKTKMGRRQEAKRFDSFTPKAVHWYFDIRDGQYGWIKPENTVNVDEGGIMTGFGLDSLVVGSADPKRKAFLKGPQTRNWTSFIEAVTADGRALVPGIIFKGKELQKQWFLEEFKQIADWYYITSPNGWTDDHIGIEWLERVYLPQTTPADESDARLIILDGHGSHATDEWMATCFMNNVYCCYLPAHCSHGLQPLDNGVFNALKAAYRRELERFASLTDSAPMDKVNFIRAYAKARRVGMTKKNILSGWRVTGNWPISRAKALRHPEIQQDRPNGSPRVTPEPRPYLGSDDTPQTSRQIRDLGLNKTPKTRRRYNVIAKGFEAHQQTVAAHTQRIASLEEELARLKRGKKRKAVPNPNKRFMTLGETLAESRFGNGEDSVSHAENTARNLYPHVSIATPPNLDRRKGNIEARFFCADEDGMKAAIDSQVPIIGNDQQHYQWNSHELPIKQLFDQWKDDQDLKVSAQIPSRRKTAVSHEKRKLKDVLSKFQDDKEPDVPLNVLDMRDRCRNVYPKFLPSIEQELLHLICDGSWSAKSAQRDAVSAAEALRYKIMKEGSLLAQRGSHTDFHTDSGGLGTWITVQQGKFGFFWKANFTREEREAWRRDRTYNNGKVRYAVLRARQTIFFPPGTIHAAVRLEDTYSITGHILRWCDIKVWLEVLEMQRDDQETTNEDMTDDDILWLLESARNRINSRIKRGCTEAMGGTEEAHDIMKEIKRMTIKIEACRKGTKRKKRTRRR